MRAARRLLGTTAVTALALAGCSPHAGPAASGAGAPPPTLAGSPTPSPTPSDSAAGFYRLVQYPEAGFDDFYAQTRAAEHSIDMEMYELADTIEETMLVEAANRGVEVRVLLDYDFSGHAVNQPAFDYLTAHGVMVRWAPTGVIFHIKATTFDATTSDVSTANLTSKYYADTRDATIVDTDPVQVQAIEDTFAGDWGLGSTGRPAADTRQAAGLIWSPLTDNAPAQTAVVAQIDAAARSVYFESEEISDTAVADALAAAARRGVTCQVVMTDSKQWHSTWTALTEAGCHVRSYPNRTGVRYIHEKLILDDAGTPSASLLLGSQNASSSSLTRNRELGLLLTARQAPDVVAAVAATFGGDFAEGTDWAAAAPATPSAGPASTGPASPLPAGSTSCTPLTNAGNCYRPGEQCRTVDRGKSGLDANGRPITCAQDNDWRWTSS